MRLLAVLAAAVLASLTLAPDARAVGTRTFELDSLDRLSGGDLKGVSIGSDGVVRAGWTLGDVPLPEPSGAAAICAAQLPSGAILVGVSGGKVIEVTADHASVNPDTKENADTALAVDKTGAAYAATTSNKIYTLAQGKSDVAATLADVESVYALVADPRSGALYAGGGAGSSGKVVRVEPGGASSVYLKTNEPLRRVARRRGRRRRLRGDERQGDALPDRRPGPRDRPLLTSAARTSTPSRSARTRSCGPSRTRRAAPRAKAPSRAARTAPVRARPPALLRRCETSSPARARSGGSTRRRAPSASCTTTTSSTWRSPSTTPAFHTWARAPRGASTPWTTPIRWPSWPTPTSARSARSSSRPGAASSSAAIPRPFTASSPPVGPMPCGRASRSTPGCARASVTCAGTARVRSRCPPEAATPTRPTRRGARGARPSRRAAPPRARPAASSRSARACATRPRRSRTSRWPS